MFDVAIIGAGIVGTAIARELSKYQLQLILIEKDSDVANGTTKANTAVIHAGFDAYPGSLKAKLNVIGNRLYENLCYELEVPFRRTGSLVISFDEGEHSTIHDLYNKGIKNGVPGLKIIDKKKLLTIEPGLNKTAFSALYAPTAAITDPCLLTIALAESAVLNGTELLLESKVTAIKKIKDSGKSTYYQINCGNATVNAKYVINAAGLYSVKINNMVNTPTFKTLPGRGQYYLFDRGTGDYVNHILFPCPNEFGRGIILTSTVHGNLLAGPSAEGISSLDLTETTPEGLAFIKKNALKIKKELPFNDVITSFSGIRAKTDSKDFIIEEASESPGFINVAGIDSPGLAAAPGIADYVVNLLLEKLGSLLKKSSFKSSTKNKIPFMKLSDSEKSKYFRKDSRYGRIVCRCEGITEGEIVEALKDPVGAKTVDGVKKRTRAGSGRCQGGFCSPKVIHIIARELNIELDQVKKDTSGSYILTGPTKYARVN